MKQWNNNPDANSKTRGMTRRDKMKFEAKQRRILRLLSGQKTPFIVDTFDPDEHRDNADELNEALETSGVMDTMRGTLNFEEGNDNDW